MTLDEIIQGCKKGNGSCQEALVHQFAPKLLAVCRRYCSERDMAQDALQETFINVFKYINSFNGSGSFEGWIRRVAVNASIQVVKKYKPYDFKEDSHMETLMETEIPDASINLGVEQIMSLLEHLPKSLKLVFNLYVVEGYNHNEIGEMLNITSSTSRSHLTKARAKLIDLLQNQETHLPINTQYH